MFQQLINPIKLEAVANFYICVAELNILQKLFFSPNYFYNYVSTVNQSYQTRRGGKFLHMCCRT